MKRRSLVLITVDCLRADRVGFGDSTGALTPFLDSLAKESTVLSDAIVAGAPTYFSFPAIMASRYPIDLGREVLGIAPGEPTIATVLQNAGYDTAAFVAGNPYLTSRFGYDQGFDRFADFMNSKLSVVPEGSLAPTNTARSALNRRLERISRGTKITATAYDELYFQYCQWVSGRHELSMDELRRYPAADVLVDAASDWLKERNDRPFFLWIHLMDPHHPYYPPQEALQLSGISDMTPRRARFLNSFWNRGDISPRRLQRHRKEVMALYDAGIRWVDHRLSRFVDVLKLHQRWTETMFVVTADHGEEFLEHGNRYHSPTELSEQLIRVPLLIRAPESSEARTVPGAFSLIHLAPTLLEALNVNVPPSFKGHGLWKDVSSGNAVNHPAIVECLEGCNNPLSVDDRIRHRLMAVRDGDFKLVLRYSRRGDDLYNLKDDPEETSPLPEGIQATQRARLLQCARKHLRDSRDHRDIGLALRARLREIRQRIELKPLPASVSRTERAVEMGQDV